MDILVAPNAFKGTLGPLAAARAMARALRARFPAARLRLLPLSDGGDGLIEAVRWKEGGRLVRTAVPGPLLRPVRAAWLLAGGGATLEMAEAAGLKYLESGRLDPLGATTFGVGALIREAVRRGARRVTVGLGGSASNDGGAGCAAGFGFRLLDGEGRPVPPGAAGLLRLRRILPPPDAAFLRGLRVAALADVSNPLCGRLGSARIFGPQKGASPAQVALIEKALLHYAAVIKRDLGADVGRAKGGAAAGGLGAGLAAFFGAELLPGAAAVLDRLGFGAAAARADLIVTGEGRLDDTTFFGKAPAEAARVARCLGKPVLLVCGSCSVRDRRGLKARGIGAAAALDELPAAGRARPAGPAAALERGLLRWLSLNRLPID